MNVAKWLQQTSNELEKAGISTARLDALVLLEDMTSKDRGRLLAHPEFELSEIQIKKLSTQIKRRATHEPLAYIRHKTEFYGREFKINKSVLEPRPESETMIDLLKALALPNDITVADIGTGCGAIGITAALELQLKPKHLFLHDIDKDALAIASYNASHFKIQTQCYPFDLLERTGAPYDIIVANLPYIPNDFHINTAAMHEPHIAIFGGQDGLDLYRRMFTQLKKNKWKPLFILIESMPPQHETLVEIAKSARFKLTQTDDFIQVFAKI